MKKIILLLTICLFFSDTYSQDVIQTNYKKFDIGVGMFTDIWMDTPKDMNARIINQGTSIYGMYNHKLGKSNISLAFGIGFGFHNLYSNNIIQDIKADSIAFVKIGDTIDYKKSKISLAYLDVPFEIRYKSRKGFRMAVGFKAGYLIDSKAKYKGERLTNDGVKVKEKIQGIKHLEAFRYGPTIRFGYKWFNITGYFSLSKIFEKDKGPELYPISVGIAIIPYY
jgi:hypothetical protein